MSEHITKSPFFVRLFELIIPITSWAIITLPLWLSFFHPALVAYLIIAFYFYFMYKSLMTVYFASLSYKLILNNQKVRYDKQITKIKQAKDIHHFILIPNYKEHLKKLEETITAMTASDYPYKKLYLVLAFEEREIDAEEKAKAIRRKYGAYFADIMESYHVLGDHEVAGKASNQAWAGRLVDEYVKRAKISPDDVVITVCDADSIMPKNFFAYLTHEYLKDADRRFHFYWAPVLLYNNFWQLPLFVRMQATLSSILRIAFLSQKDNLIHISTYSMSLWLLKEIDFWDVDIIPEDWHVYFQAFFTFGEKVKTIPLYTIVNGDAVYSGGLFKTLINRYEQEKRWAWGVSDIAYAFKKYFVTPHIRRWPKIKKIIFLIETHLLWPTTFFVLTIFALIPPLINPVFKRTVLGFLLPRLSSGILTFTTIFLIFYVYLDVKLRKRLGSHTRIRNLPLLFIQWYFLPLVSFILSAVPALESHTRIIMGKKLAYKVTEKA